MGHGQDGPSLMGQSRGGDEGPMEESPGPNRTSYTLQWLPPALKGKFRFLHLPRPCGSWLSPLPPHTPSVMPTPCLQALHVQFPLPGMLRTHACLHMHMHTHNSRLTLKHPEVSAWTSPSQEAFLRPLGQVPPL